MERKGIWDCIKTCFENLKPKKRKPEDTLRDWKRLMQLRTERLEREREEGPDPDSPTQVGLTVID